MSVTLLQHRWYSCLIKRGDNRSALEDRYTEDELNSMFVVCYNIGGRLLYSAFHSYLEFHRYQNKIKDDQKSFFEIISGYKSQKPKFDIDNLNGVDYELLISRLVRACSELVLEYRPDKPLSLEKDVCIYQSLSDTKRTFHIILNNYHHENNDQAKIFYQEIMSKMEPEYTTIIDPGVYSSRQQFRIVGSQKPNSGRPKVFLNEWKYFDRDITHIYGVPIEDQDHLESIILYESLVSVVDFSTLLRHPTIEVPSKKKKQSSEIEEISPETAIKALRLYATRGDIGIKDRMFPYKINGISGGIVSLKRTRASRCPNCNRIHHNENPYLLIVDDHVYFNCRRSDDNLYIGTLSEPIKQLEETEIAIVKEHNIEIQSMILAPLVKPKRLRPVTFQIPEFDGSTIGSLYSTSSLREGSLYSTPSL